MRECRLDPDELGRGRNKVASLILTSPAKTRRAALAALLLSTLGTVAAAELAGETAR
jgi:hypothetical protein